MHNKMKEDAVKQARKLQGQIKDALRDAEDARVAKEELAAACKEAERKSKTLEAEVMQLSEDLASSERVKRAAEVERDELIDEMQTLTNKSSLIVDEKRRLEARIASLEEELEEEQSNSEVILERNRKSQLNIEQISTELATERSNTGNEYLFCREAISFTLFYPKKKLYHKNSMEILKWFSICHCNTVKTENARALLERQSKELKAKLAEIETTQRTKVKATISALEGKIGNLEEQLENETKERLLQQKANRKLDKKIKELTLNIEDERRHADQYKEQIEKVRCRIISFSYKLPTN